MSDQNGQSRDGSQFPNGSNPGRVGKSHRFARGSRAIPRLLSIKEAVFELGISRTVVYELITAQKLRTIKIGRRRFIPIEAMEDFIASLSD
jgi:excisionase family DNA binding protein